MELVIQEGYKPCDVERMYELERISFTKEFRWQKKYFASAIKNLVVLLGVYENKIAGYVLSEFDDENAGHIVSLTVDPAYRRKGFGKQLMDFAETYHKENKSKLIKLEVHPENAAQILYYKLGYRVSGFQPNYYSNGDSAVIMTKPLGK